MMHKVKDGDPLRIPAAAYNAFVDAAEAHRAGRHDARVPRPAPSSPQTGIVSIKNNSGSDVARFGVLGIDGPLFTPADNADAFKNRVVLKGVTPAAAHAGRFAICLEPIAAGAIGQAVVAGICVAKIDVTDEAHSFADVDDGSTASLKSGMSGAATILWRESGAGEKWAIIRFGGPIAGMPAPVAEHDVIYAAGEPLAWIVGALPTGDAYGIELDEDGYRVQTLDLAGSGVGGTAADGLVVDASFGRVKLAISNGDVHEGQPHSGLWIGQDGRLMLVEVGAGAQVGTSVPVKLDDGFDTPVWLDFTPTGLFIQARPRT